MADIELFEERVAMAREDGVEIPGIRITPAFETAERMNGAGVVLVAGEWGLGDEHERIAKPLARMGFFTVSMDLVRGMRATSGVDAAARAALNHAIAIADVQAGLLCVKELARGKLGVIGLDIAAQIVVEAATTLPHIDAVVHAGGPPPGDVPLARVRAPILVHQAGEMKAAYMEMHERMKRGKAVLIGYEYETESFFARPQDEVEASDARIAFDRIRDFLVQTLT